MEKTKNQIIKKMISKRIPKPSVIVERETSWTRALNAARRTVGKEPIDKEPSRKFKLMSLMAEHAQIKLVEYRISFTDLRQWVGVHLLRHPFVVPMVHSQRVDRREDIDTLVEQVMSVIDDDIKKSDGFNKRDYLFQGEVNDQDFYVNAQTLINISRKRLCTCASPETRYAWQIVKDAIAEIDPEMAAVMVRQCVYRGRCPERIRCGYDLTEAHHKEVNEYWKLIGR